MYHLLINIYETWLEVIKKNLLGRRKIIWDQEKDILFRASHLHEHNMRFVAYFIITSNYEYKWPNNYIRYNH